MEQHKASLCLSQSRSSNICGCEAFYDHFMVVFIYPAWAFVSIATFNPTCANGQQTKTFHNLPCAPVRITGNQKTNISKTFFRAGFGQVWRLGWRPEKKESIGFCIDHISFFLSYLESFVFLTVYWLWAIITLSTSCTPGQFSVFTPSLTTRSVMRIIPSIWLLNVKLKTFYHLQLHHPLASSSDYTQPIYPLFLIKHHF